MSYFRRVGMFGSASLVAHLVRGATAAVLLTWAVAHQTTDPWLSLGAGATAFVALRGCPIRWSVGLIETVAQRRRELRPDKVIASSKPGLMIDQR